MNPAMLSMIQQGVNSAFTLLSEKGRIKGLKQASKKAEERINLSQSAKLKVMSENFIQKVHDFNNAFAVAQSDARNKYDTAQSDLNMSTIGMQGSSYFQESRNNVNQQYNDMMVNMLEKHKEDYRRMDLMNTNEFNSVLNNYSQQRLDNVEKLYSNVMQVYSETNQALIGAIAPGIRSAYQYANSGQLPSTQTDYVGQANNIIGQPQYSTQLNLNPVNFGGIGNGK